MSKVKYYNLSNLELVEIEFLSSYELAAKKSKPDVERYNKKDRQALVHHVQSKLGAMGTNHKYKGYSNWITIQRLSDIDRDFVRRNLITCLAVSVLRLFRKT